MYVFLTSSPCVEQAPRAIINPENHFLINLLSVLPEKPNVLFVASDPNAAEFTDQMAGEMAWALHLAGVDCQNTEVLDNRNPEQIDELLSCSDLVVLCGGHVPTQNAFFREIGLRDRIKKYDGVVLGISAGTMNAADRVYMQPEEPGETEMSFQRFAEGLGLTELNVLPHYQQVRDSILDGQRLFEDVTYQDSMGECFFALVDGSYFLLGEDGSTTLYGEAYCIRDGQIEQIAELGDIVPFSEV